ncbi:MAG: efflux RND transporter periplasmic adaptor subunit [Caulobacteraceae bacterium]|nr:efflux RND transporter periplasmic adaptor subunit [Caulobacteraceae bacterium]
MPDFRRARLALCALAVLSIAACQKKEEPKPQPRAVTAATVSMAALPMTVDASGTIAAWQEIPVGSEAGGYEAVQVLVDEGSYVRQGQLLVKLNDRLLRAQLASAQATVNQTAAALSRARELNAKGYLAKAALDTAVANAATAQAGLAEARARLDQTNIRAPVSGQITARSVVKGQIVTAGAELFRLVRQGQIELNAQVPQAQLALLRPGMTAAVTGDQQPPTTGSVRLITPQVDPQTRLGLARITLPPGSGYRPGDFARASINVGSQPALVVPQSAVVFRVNQSGVYVIGADNHVRFTPVTTGLRQGGLVAVTGLRPGQKVVVSGAGFLAENALVKVSAEPAPATTGASAR